jgi:hypothetical protein
MPPARRPAHVRARVVAERDTADAAVVAGIRWCAAGELPEPSTRMSVWRSNRLAGSSAVAQPSAEVPCRPSDTTLWTRLGRAHLGVHLAALMVVSTSQSQIVVGVGLGRRIDHRQATDQADMSVTILLGLLRLGSVGTSLFSSASSVRPGKVGLDSVSLGDQSVHQVQDGSALCPGAAHQSNAPDPNDCGPPRHWPTTSTNQASGAGRISATARRSSG